MNSTLIQRHISNKSVVTEESLDDFIDEWHSLDIWRNWELYQAMGISKEEYFSNILNTTSLVTCLNNHVSKGVV